MLATSIIADSKGSFLDAKNSRIIYKNDVGDLSPILCQLVCLTVLFCVCDFSSSRKIFLVFLGPLEW